MLIAAILPMLLRPFSHSAMLYGWKGCQAERKCPLRGLGSAGTDKSETSAMSITQKPPKDIFKNAVDVLAALLPQDIKKQCDELLDENAESRETWSLYQTTLTHHLHREAAK